MSAPDLPTGQIPLIPGWTAHQVKKALRDYYRRDSRQWVVFEEFTPFTGGGVSRIDALAINCYNGNRYQTVAYEIKVSRGDFLAEIKRPIKRRLALAWSNAFYFLTPEGLIKPAEVPIECGLREVMPDLSIRTVIQAELRDRLPPSWAFVAAVARRVQKLEMEAERTPEATRN